MSVANLHDEIEIKSNGLPAAYLVTNSIARQNVSALVKNLDQLTGVVLPAGIGKLDAVLESVNWSQPPSAKIVPSRTGSSDIDLAVDADFSLRIAVHISGNPKDVISVIEIRVRNARTTVFARDNAIIFEGSDFDLQRSFRRTPNADELIESANIDPLEAARVEGHIGYGVVSNAVAEALGKKRSMSLARLFPAVNFGVSLVLQPLASGEALGIFPTSNVTLNVKDHCFCQAGDSVEYQSSTITNIAPPDPGPNSEIGTIQLGGPAPSAKDPLSDFGRRFEGDGIAGLFVPQTLAEEFTSETLLAIKPIVEDDRSTIGFRADAGVGFRRVGVSFDVPRGGIIVDFELDISSTISANIEDFKGKRHPFAWGAVQPAPGSSATMKIGFYPAADSSGSIKLSGVILDADYGDYVAVVTGVGPLLNLALKIIGVGGSLAAFLIDLVLSAVLTHLFPIELKKSVEKFIGSSGWKLLDGFEIAKPFDQWFPAAPFHAKNGSLLVSFRHDG